jgi:hypothetical protein
VVNFLIVHFLELSQPRCHARLPPGFAEIGDLLAVVVEDVMAIQAAADMRSLDHFQKFARESQEARSLVLGILGP